MYLSMDLGMLQHLIKIWWIDCLAEDIKSSCAYAYLHDESRSFYSNRLQCMDYLDLEIDSSSTFDPWCNRNIHLNSKSMDLLFFQLTFLWLYSYPSGLVIKTNTQSKLLANSLISTFREVSSWFNRYEAVAAEIHSLAWIVDWMKIVGFPCEIRIILILFSSLWWYSILHTIAFNIQVYGTL